MTQEFLLSVTPVRGDEYLVRTERVAPGVLLAEELVTLPVEEWLALARQLMNDPLLSLLEPVSVVGQRGRGEKNILSSLDIPRPNLAALGQQLYNGLFQGNLRDSWMNAQAIAQHRQERIQLRLGLKGARLRRLPWEVLHAGDRPLATGTDVVFSRYQPGVNLRPQSRIIAPGQPLKILMAIAAPTDQEALQLKREALHLQQELQNRPNGKISSNLSIPQIELTILEQPDREQLTQTLEQGQYQIFHYAGHSNLAARGGELYLVSGRTGLTETLSGDDLAGLLANNGILMAVFNSCRSASSDITDTEATERNLAAALVKRGIPAVLAMAERIPDEVALTLTRLFYRNLNQGYPVDLSLSRARAGLISAYGSQELYWALPILYLDLEFDGYFNGKPEARDWGLAREKEEENSSPRQNPYLPSFPVLREGQSMALTSQGLRFNGDVEDLVGAVTDEDEWDDRHNSVLIANFRRELGKGNLSTEQETRERKQEKSAVSPSSLKKQNNRPKESRLKPPSKVVKKTQKKSIFWRYCLFPGGFLTSMVLGFWLWQNRGPKPGEFLPIGSPSPMVSRVFRDDVSAVNLKMASSSQVQAIAIEMFNQGKISQGQQAVEELLDAKRRQALQQAELALSAAGPTVRETPEIKFLWGRLAWQSIQSNKNNNKYSVDDARRYWESAVKDRPESLKYRNALGFALYLEGNLNQAYQVWLEVLDLMENHQEGTEDWGMGTRVIEEDSSVHQQSSSKEALTALAGLGLVRMQQAQARGISPQQRMDLLNEANSLRRQVMAQDAESFTPNSLSQNWLWPQKAIGDWRMLQKEGTRS
ncbi:heterocyst differentiation protein [Oscillatoriales cyanobacterium USR001]|nr:heterocyst differentiation protein [Oscillatoriales cyanobacterium USR001]